MLITTDRPINQPTNQPTKLGNHNIEITHRVQQPKAMRSLYVLFLASILPTVIESFATPQSGIHDPSLRINGRSREHQRQHSCNRQIGFLCQSSEDDGIMQEEEGTILSRRNIIQSLTAAAAGMIAVPFNAIAEEQVQLAPISSSSSTSPPITHKVNFNVRISRADGTFYVRDDPPGTIPTADNQVFTGTITLGLYGTYVPNHVSKFLDYVGDKGGSYDPFEDVPTPSYSRSMFTTFLQSNGLLIGGTIPGLHLTTLNGASALEYRGRISAASLWIDKFSQSQETRKKISHSRSGLLTHRNFDVLPNFGITTREAMELDGSHTVFGELIPTESSNAFLRRIVDLPTYSNTKSMSLGTNPSNTGNTINAMEGGQNSNNRAVEEAASSFYSFQKDLFRSAAKTFGDTRLDNIYEGKILRRVEVTSVNVETL